MEQNFDEQRNQIIGLGENSFKKSYYPELQAKILELETSYRNVANIFDSINDALVLHDENGDIYLLNKQAQILFNLKDDEKAKYRFFDLLSERTVYNELFEIFRDVLNGNPRIIGLIIRQINKDIEINVQASLNKIFWHGKYLVVAVIRDFSERIKFENELIRAKEKAEESDRLKTSFLQNMSHEIRTPLNAICGFSSFLSNPDISDEKRKNFVSIIQNGSSRLLAIVSDVLTISALETKQEKVKIEKVSINPIVFEILETFEQQAKNKKIILSAKRQLSDKLAEVYTDKNKLEQIITNLIKNALKYTNEGCIEFGYILKQNELEFFVKDSGIGIIPQLQEKIFERFRQSDQSLSANRSGTGLGLSIAKGFVELLKGKIWVESEMGKGSTFYFTIPYKPVNELDKSYIPNKKKLSGKTVLIAEDEEINFYFLELVLKKMNFTVIYAQNGKEALEACKLNPIIDLILMDIKMPVMDGYTAAKLIKKFRPDLPIIAQSAYASLQERENYGDIFDEYLVKPIMLDKLNAVIQKYIEAETNNF